MLLAQPSRRPGCDSAREAPDDQHQPASAVQRWVPEPSDDQLNRIIALKSRGTLSSTINSGVVRLSGEGAINLRLLNLFETVEAVFYNQLLYNVTNWVDGFQPPPWIDYDYFVEFLTIARTDSEMHALDAARTMTTQRPDRAPPLHPVQLPCQHAQTRRSKSRPCSPRSPSA